MLKHIFIGLILLFSIHVIGQKTDTNIEDTYSNYPIQSYLRGKVGALFIIEDFFITTATIGAEFRFKRHSLGLDYTSFKQTTEQDNEMDIPMYDNIEKRKYLLADYKFNLNPGDGRNVYINLYFKKGSYNAWYETFDYDLTQSDSIMTKNHSSGQFREIGVGLGLKKNFGQSPYGVDISANLAMQYSTTDIYTYYNYEEYILQDNARDELPVFYTRLNLYCLID
jgi:hypothetical protein